MQTKILSPQITHMSWGKIQVAGKSFKDVKCFPGGCREWDWNETGTRHVPGIQPADVEELLEKGARVIVLSKGVHQRLQVCPQTIEILQQKGIDTYVLQTEEAVKKYNELCEMQLVGGLFHSTC